MTWTAPESPTVRKEGYARAIFDGDGGDARELFLCIGATPDEIALATNAPLLRGEIDRLRMGLAYIAAMDAARRYYDRRALIDALLVPEDLLGVVPHRSPEADSPSRDELLFAGGSLARFARAYIADNPQFANTRFRDEINAAFAAFGLADLAPLTSGDER
jgi:hypothetical protein